MITVVIGVLIFTNRLTIIAQWLTPLAVRVQRSKFKVEFPLASGN